MRVPFLDLKAQYPELRAEVEAAFGRVLDAAAFAGGPFVEEFEARFAEYCGSRHVVGVNSGTTALWIALRALGIGEGDEVITTPLTFVATAAAIRLAGATPVFADIDPATTCLSPDAAARAVTPRTRAIIPVHLYGQPADMEPILRLAEERGLHVVEDAAQAHGAAYRGRGVGTLGRVGCFSFYPGKNLGAYGEGGAVVTDDDEVAGRARMLRDHGQRTKHEHELLGLNGRMDGIQAAILSVKLTRIAEWTRKRRAIAERYDEELADLPDLTLPARAADRTHVYHLYVVRHPRRDELMAALRARGVECAVHYPRPVHLQPAFRELGYAAGSLPAAERVAGQILSLPLYPELTDAQQEHVVRTVRGCVRELAGGPRVFAPSA